MRRSAIINLEDMNPIEELTKKKAKERERFEI